MPDPDRPDWWCGCTNDHRMTIERAWCSACSEWCYESDLCVRGRVVQVEAQLISVKADLMWCIGRIESEGELPRFLQRYVTVRG